MKLLHLDLGSLIRFPCRHLCLLLQR
jgi:hypothetical protein